MRLNPNANIPAFLQAVQSCEDAVCFVTQEGDILTLKSVLSQFVFTAVIAGKRSRALRGSSQCRIHAMRSGCVITAFDERYLLWT